MSDAKVKDLKNVEFAKIDELKLKVDQTISKYDNLIIKEGIIVKTLQDIEMLYSIFLHKSTAMLSENNMLSRNHAYEYSLENMIRGKVNSEQLRFLAYTAPKSMDPKKVDFHISCFINVLSESFLKQKDIEKVKMYIQNNAKIIDISSCRLMLVKLYENIEAKKEQSRTY